MLLVVDTNIIVSALKTKDKKSMSLRLMKEIMIGLLVMEDLENGVLLIMELV